MDYLKGRKWDDCKTPVPLVKSHMTVSDGSLKLDLFSVPERVSNNHVMSLFNLACMPHTKAFLYEIPFARCVEHAPDIIVGFAPHPDARDIVVDVRVSLEPKRILDLQAWTCRVSAKDECTPFLYGEFPFPKVRFFDSKITLACGSRLKPSIICANVQCVERRRLALANLFLPEGEPLFPSLRARVSGREDIVLRRSL